MTPLEAQVRWVEHTMKDILIRLETVEEQNKLLREVIKQLTKK